MSSKFLKQTKKYLTKITVVAVALAMATTLAFGQSGSGKLESAEEEDKTERVYERMIAHGGGTVEGFDTSSSVDAVNMAINNGFKLIELDMEFSADNKIIMLHDWDRTVITYLGRKFDIKLTEKQFNNQLICGKFEPLTFEKLTKILDSNPQVRIVTDTKGDNIKLLTTIAEKYPAYISRMVPQIYDYSEFETVSSLGYSDIIFTLYMQDKINYNQLLGFVKRNDIYAVTVGKDYWIKGLPEKLSRDGIVVYTHPIYTVEEAEEEFKRGVYGVYSSTLIPSEIEEHGAEFYLMQMSEKGKAVKLTDAAMPQDRIRTVKNHGNMDYKACKYKLDGENLETRLSEIEDSPSEAHELTIEIWDISGKSEEKANVPIYIMKYILTKNEGEVRILDTKYAYRLKALKKLPEFQTIMDADEKNKPAEEIMDILSKSFIAKAGKYYYYNNSISGSYSVGDELMSAQKSISGNVIVPLAETIKELGAKNIMMDSGRYIYIAMNDSRTVSQVYSNFVRKDTYNTKISVPISLYRNKAMAGGEIIFVASGRDFIEDKGLLIVLPENCKVSDKMAEKLAEYADFLYKDQSLLQKAQI